MFIDIEVLLLQSGAICLHAAARRGHTAVVKALLAKGAHVDAKTRVSQGR